MATNDEVSEHTVTVEWKRETPDFDYSGEKTPIPAELAKMHEQAYHACFIANSVKTEVDVGPA